MIINELSGNERFKPICGKLTEMAMSLLIESSGADEETVAEVQKIVDDVKVTLNNIIAIDKESYATEEEYKQVVVDEFKGALSENGIDLDSFDMDEESKAELETVIADAVIENIENIDEVTDAELANIMLQYYSEYMNKNGGSSDGSDTPEIPEIPGISDIPSIPGIGSGNDFGG